MADVVTVLFKEFLNFNPNNPNWINRDRFVLSAGHGSMLLYSLLYLTGYKSVSLEDIKNELQVLMEEADLIGETGLDYYRNLSSKENQIISYYTLILHVGYDEKKHGYINPCLNIIEDKLSIDLLGDDYRPMQFFP